MKNLSNVLWGIVLVIIGIILGLNALNITNLKLFFRGWWTFFIIIPCFIDLLTSKKKTGNLIGLIIGVLLLLSCQKIIEFKLVWKLTLPIIIIIIGLSCIFKNFIGSKVNRKIDEINKKNNNTERKEYAATFSGQKLNFANDKFEGCSLSAVFGGIELDLRNSIIKEDVVINASSIFGGITIIAPENVNIKVLSSSIFGGVSNKKASNDKAKETIYINAKCLFGGVDIKWVQHKE